MIDLEKLEEYIKEYLLTRPDDWEEWYATYRHFARAELNMFTEWLERKNLEEERAMIEERFTFTIENLTREQAEKLFEFLSSSQEDEEYVTLDEVLERSAPGSKNRGVGAT